MIAELLMILMSVFLMAVAGIGIECYNQNSSWNNNKQRQNNKNFMIAMIVFAILGLIMSVFLLARR